MRFLIQQVSKASIIITTPDLTSPITRSIQQGIIVYVGISHDDLDDYQPKIEKFIQKIQSVRILRNTSSPEQKNTINASLTDIQGSVLLASNFTLYSRNKKGNAVDYTHSAPYLQSQTIYQELITQCHHAGLPYQTGEFGAEMNITATNIGPINHLREY